MTDASPQEDLPFGDLVVRLGLASADAVRDAVAEQARLYAAGTRVRLGQLLIRRGALTPDQAWAVLEAQGKKIMGCPACQVFYNVEDLGSGMPPPCPACGESLERPTNLEAVKRNLDVAATVRLRRKQEPPPAGA